MGTEVIIGVCVGFVLLVVIVITFGCKYARKRKKDSESTSPTQQLLVYKDNGIQYELSADDPGRYRRHPDKRHSRSKAATVSTSVQGDAVSDNRKHRSRHGKEPKENLYNKFLKERERERALVGEWQHSENDKLLSLCDDDRAYAHSYSRQYHGDRKSNSKRHSVVSDVVGARKNNDATSKRFCQTSRKKEHLGGFEQFQPALNSVTDEDTAHPSNQTTPSNHHQHISVAGHVPSKHSSNRTTHENGATDKHPAPGRAKTADGPVNAYIVKCTTPRSRTSLRQTSSTDQVSVKEIVDSIKRSSRGDIRRMSQGTLIKMDSVAFNFRNNNSGERTVKESHDTCSGVIKMKNTEDTDGRIPEAQLNENVSIALTTNDSHGERLLARDRVTPLSTHANITNTSSATKVTPADTSHDSHEVNHTTHNSGTTVISSRVQKRAAPMPPNETPPLRKDKRVHRIYYTASPVTTLKSDKTGSAGISKQKRRAPPPPSATPPFLPMSQLQQHRDHSSAKPGPLSNTHTQMQPPSQGRYIPKPSPPPPPPQHIEAPSAFQSTVKTQPTSSNRPLSPKIHPSPAPLQPILKHAPLPPNTASSAYQPTTRTQPTTPKLDSSTRSIVKYSPLPPRPPPPNTIVKTTPTSQPTTTKLLQSASPPRPISNYAPTPPPLSPQAYSPLPYKSTVNALLTSPQHSPPTQLQSPPPPLRPNLNPTPPIPTAKSPLSHHSLTSPQQSPLNQLHSTPSSSLRKKLYPTPPQSIAKSLLANQSLVDSKLDSSHIPPAPPLPSWIATDLYNQELVSALHSSSPTNQQFEPTPHTQSQFYSHPSPPHVPRPPKAVTISPISLVSRAPFSPPLPPLPSMHDDTKTDSSYYYYPSPPLYGPVLNSADIEYMPLGVAGSIFNPICLEDPSTSTVIRRRLPMMQQTQNESLEENPIHQKRTEWESPDDIGNAIDSARTEGAIAGHGLSKRASFSSDKGVMVASNVSINDFNPRSISTPLSSMTEVPCRTNSSLINSVLRKRRQKLVHSDTTIMDSFHFDSESDDEDTKNATVSSIPLPDKEETNASILPPQVPEDHQDLPMKIANVRNIIKDPDVGALLADIRARRRSSTHPLNDFNKPTS